MKATLYSTDGTVKKIEPKNGTDFKLVELYKLICCEMVQIVPMTDDTILIIDEEGKLLDKPAINEKATMVWQKYYGDTDIIIGNCIHCSNKLVK